MPRNTAPRRKKDPRLVLTPDELELIEDLLADHVPVSREDEEVGDGLRKKLDGLKLKTT